MAFFAISGQFGGLTPVFGGSSAPCITHPPLGTSRFVKHVLITVKEKDKRASTNMPGLLGPKFRNDTLTCLLYSSGWSKSCGQAQSQSEQTLESDMAKDLATRRDKLGSLMPTGSCGRSKGIGESDPLLTPK